MLHSSQFNKHLQKQEDKDVFYSVYDENIFLRDIISKVVTDKLDSCIREAEKKDIYKDSNWSLYQADNLGYRRALREILTLLNQEKLKEENNDRLQPGIDRPEQPEG